MTPPRSVLRVTPAVLAEWSRIEKATWGADDLKRLLGAYESRVRWDSPEELDLLIASAEVLAFIYDPPGRKGAGSGFGLAMRRVAYKLREIREELIALTTP